MTDLSDALFSLAQLRHRLRRMPARALQVANIDSSGKMRRRQAFEYLLVRPFAVRYFLMQAGMQTDRPTLADTCGIRH
jgi:hypothetical protein